MGTPTGALCLRVRWPGRYVVPGPGVQDVSQPPGEGDPPVLVVSDGKPFVSLKGRGAGWESRVPRKCSTYPWTSRSTDRVLGFRTFRPMRLVLGEVLAP